MRTADHSDPRGLYAVLEVDPSASDAELRAAYRAAARRWHPDLNASPEARERMILVVAAREELLDPARRRSYDQTAARAVRLDAAPTSIDAGLVVVGAPVRHRVVVSVRGALQWLDIPRHDGGWWTLVDVELDADKQTLELTVDLRAADTGEHADHLTVLAEGVELRIPISCTARHTIRSRIRRTATARTARRAIAPHWAPRFTTFARVGLVALVLASLINDSLIGFLAGDANTPTALSDATSPWVFAPICVTLAATTGWCTRGTLTRRSLVAITAMFGWAVLLIVGVTVAIIVLLAVAAIALVAVSLFVVLGILSIFD